MNPRKRCSAIKALLLVVLLSPMAWAQAATSIGSVTHQSGPLFVKKLDGSVRVLSVNSVVEVGDTLSTTDKGYVQIRFSDDSQLTLQPNTVVVLDKFAYDPAVPAADDYVLRLQRGGIQSDAGKLGARSKERTVLLTPIARVGLQSASVVVQYRAPQTPVASTARSSQQLAVWASGFESVAMQSDNVIAFIASVAARYTQRLADAAAWLESTSDSVGTGAAQLLAAVAPAPVSGVAPGLYTQVLDGGIIMSTPGGTQKLGAGQFGFIPNESTPPVVLPQNPGVKFTAPVSFSAPGTSGSAQSTMSNTVDCEVR